MKASAEFILADYAQRCADHRRYVRLFSTHASVIVTLLTLVCGWTFSKEPEARPTWALLWVVLIANVDLLFMAFHFHIRVLLLSYLLDIEKVIDDVAQGCCGQQALHQPDGCPHPRLFFGYHHWRSMCNQQMWTRVWIVTLAVLFGLAFLGLEIALLYFAFSDSHGPTGRYQRLMVAVLVALPLIAGGWALFSVVRLLKHSSRLNQCRPFASWVPDDQEAFVNQVMSLDFAQRNEDARALMDYYVALLLWPTTAFGGIVAFSCAAPHREWVFLFIPPVALLCLCAVLLVYRFFKRLKRYLEKVEAFLDARTQAGVCPMVHRAERKRSFGRPFLRTWGNYMGKIERFLAKCMEVRASQPMPPASTRLRGYRVGFFRVVRRQHVQQTESLDVPLQAWLAFLGGGAAVAAMLWFCYSAAQEWIRWPPDWPTVGYLGVMGLLTVTVLLTFLGSRSIGSDPCIGGGSNVYSSSLPHVLVYGCVLAAAIELFTVWMRFGVGLQSTRDTMAMAPWTLGLRIHHGYVGLVLLLACLVLGGRPAIRNLIAMIGIGLLVSDLVHHFVVLWLTTGSPEFHLLYPSEWKKQA